MAFKTRDGSEAHLLGFGPLTRQFRKFEVDGIDYLVWAGTLRYRMDFHPDGSPVDHPLDILETEE